MKNNTLLILIVILIVNTGYGQLVPEGWFQQTSNLSSTLNSVYFIDSYTGWSAGDNGVILSTTNGGEIWENQKSSVFNNLNNLIFTSPDTGYVIGTTGFILKSINAGLNWIQLSSGTFNDLTSSSFVNNSTGYICGLNNTISKTTNGGTNWNSISFEDSVDYYSIYFINNSTGWLSSVKRFSTVYDTAYILKTIDGGANWFAQHSRMNDAVPNLSLQFTDSLNGWCTWQIPALSGSEILKTTDGGNNWISYGGFFTGDHYYLYFVNNQIGWCAGRSNNIFRTENGGVNWIRSNSFGASFSYESIYFIDTITGWTVGSNGRILKTTTGGVLTNFSNISSEIPDKFFLSQNYPNPFNPRTIINYELGITNEVIIKVYDVLGNEVANLVNENKLAGIYEVEFDGSGFASGIYFYKLEAGEFSETKRMVLLK